MVKMIATFIVRLAVLYLLLPCSLFTNGQLTVEYQMQGEIINPDLAPTSDETIGQANILAIGNALSFSFFLACF